MLKMKELIRNNVYGFLLMAGFTLVATSCQKDKNENPAATNDAGNINTSVVIPELCSPIPDSLQPPAGNNLFLQTFARGVQIYEVQRNPANPSELVWVNIAPLASLYTNSNFTNLIINHFAGPSWQFVKGPFKDEKVVAKKVKGSTQDPTAIQWLLLQADPTLSTPGNPVSFVQRICTHGGLQPKELPTQLGKLDSIPYTASYLFYTKN